MQRRRRRAAGLQRRLDDAVPGEWHTSCPSKHGTRPATRRQSTARSPSSTRRSRSSARRESTYGQPAAITVQVPSERTPSVEFDDASTGAPLCIKAAHRERQGHLHVLRQALPSGCRTTCSSASPATRRTRWRSATFQYTVDRKPATMTATAQNGHYGTTTRCRSRDCRRSDRRRRVPHGRNSAVHRDVATRRILHRRRPHARPGQLPGRASYLGDDLYLPARGHFRLAVHEGRRHDDGDTDVELDPSRASRSHLSRTACPTNATATVCSRRTARPCAPRRSARAATCDRYRPVTA